MDGITHPMAERGECRLMALLLVSAQDPDRYGKEVTVNIDDFVAEERVRCILMLGKLLYCTRDSALLGPLGEAFRSKSYVRVMKKGRVRLNTSKEGDVLNAVRGAASSAQGGGARSHYGLFHEESLSYGETGMGPWS